METTKHQAQNVITQIICVGVLISMITIAAVKSYIDTPKRTTLTVHNASKTDTVTAYLTLGPADTTHWVYNTKGIFGITTTGAQGSFTLAPGQYRSYTSKRAMAGNISFNSPPLNCPNQITVCEFCINNHGTVPKAQETVEISCVSGVSYIANIYLSNKNWTANYPGYDTIQNIQNGPIGTNNGRPGVYPFGCDDCTTATSQAPSCTIGKNEKQQRHAICNVQRNAKLSGGSMTISYMRKVK